MTGKKGFRSNKKPTTKQKLEAIETNLENLSKALQMANAMIKHLNNRNQALENDLNNAMGIINDFQYRTLSMIELADYGKEELEAEAQKLKLKDFYAASDQEDIENNYIDNSANEIGEDSVIIITSDIKDPVDEKDAEGGILRSKFEMEKCTTPDIREALLGSKVGDKMEIELNGKTHILEVLDHKIKEKAEEVTATEKSDEE